MLPSLLDSFRDVASGHPKIVITWVVSENMELHVNEGVNGRERGKEGEREGRGREGREERRRKGGGEEEMERERERERETG